ncbi:hypothetical protein ACA910_011981 [Epithemia clementina (nom. ined.)]
MMMIVFLLLLGLWQDTATCFLLPSTKYSSSPNRLRQFHFSSHGQENIHTNDGDGDGDGDVEVETSGIPTRTTTTTTRTGSYPSSWESNNVERISSSSSSLNNSISRRYRKRSTMTISGIEVATSFSDDDVMNNNQNKYFGLPSQRPPSSSQRKRSTTVPSSLSSSSSSLRNGDLATRTGVVVESNTLMPHLSSSLSSSSQSQPPQWANPPMTISVCMSPGCLADGSLQALDLLQALAPPHVTVQTGPCRSFCGSGPLVTTTTTTSTDTGKTFTKSYKRMDTPEKLLSLLYPSPEEEQEESFNDKRVVEPQLPNASSSSSNTSMTKSMQALWRGYQLGTIQGMEAFEKQTDYPLAIRLFEQAVAVAFRPAMELQSQRDEYNKHYGGGGAGGDPKKKFSSSTVKPTLSLSSSTEPPSRLKWLIQVRRMEALAKLELKDYDGALLAIQASCNLSRNTGCSESLAVLARVYQCKNDMAGERQALTNLLEQPMPTATVGGERQLFALQNERRLAELRLQKLTFLMSKQQPQSSASPKKQSSTVKAIGLNNSNSNNRPTRSSQ